MNKHTLRRTAVAAVTLATVLTNAGALSSAEIKKDLDSALFKRNTAHQLAESARTLGVDENHYTIWYAKKMWNTHNETVIDLTKQYNAAVAEEKKKAEENAKGVYAGTFRCTGYSSDPSENAGYSVTATGVPLAGNEWVICAVDPSVIPLGTKIYIEGVGTMTACDVGGAIRGNSIDILMPASQMNSWGVQYRKVYIKK